MLISEEGDDKEFQQVGFDNQQDFTNYFNVLGAFPMPEPASNDSAYSYVVTNIKSLKTNGRYVLSSSSAPSLQKLTTGSNLQMEYKNNRDTDLEKAASFP